MICAARIWPTWRPPGWRRTRAGCYWSLNPQGQLPELLVRLPLADPAAFPPRFAAAGGYALAARFQQLSTHPAQNIPGVQGLAGRLVVDGDSGRLDLAGSGLRLEAPWLRAPLDFTALRGPLQWRRSQAGLLLNSAGIDLARDTLAVHLQGAATLFDDGSSPLLDLKLSLKNIDFGQIRQLVPAPSLHPSLVKWLDRALVSGRVPTSELTLRGRPAEFPFDKDQGLFEARVQLSDATLDYDPVWPRLEALNAQLLLRNRVFRVETATARMLGAEVPRLQAKITDITQQPVLELEGHGKGSGTTLLRLLRETPAGRKAGPYLKDMQLTGDTTMDLAMQIPLDPRPNTWQGVVYCDGNELKMSDWGLELQRIQGKLSFTDQSLTASDIRLVLRGEAARLDIDTNSQGGGTQFRLRGQAGVRNLGANAATLLAPYAEGRSRWEAVLGLTADRPDELSLELASDLVGTALKLPAPLDKPAAVPRALRLRARLDRKTANLQVRIEYQPAVRGLLQILDFPARPRFDRGELRIDSGEARLPQSAGLSVIAHLQRLDLSAPQQGDTAMPGLPDWLTMLQIQVDQLLVAGQTFARLSLEAQQRRKVLSVELDSPTLAGSLNIPGAPSPAQPVDIRLRRLALNSGNDEHHSQDNGYDPRSLPPLRLTVEDLLLNGNSVGNLQVNASPQANGLRLDKLQLRSNLHQFNASGDWLKTAGGNLSRLQASLKSSDLGKTLQTFGYRAALQGGQAEAELKVSWPAALPAFSPELLQGALELRIRNGQLPEVEPGVGRLMGLVNLFSLVRRLRLDFSDLFGEGLSFDSIDGKFRFASGRADTDMDIQIPSGRIQMEGQVNFKNRTYQQTARVIPQLSTSLAIAGTLAGGPVIGAVAFMAGQVLKPGLDQILRLQYSITGSWDNPTIAPLNPASGTAPANRDAVDNPPVPTSDRPLLHDR